MRIFTQAFALIRQNRFFSVVSILGTAVSITFVMVVYMVYDISSGNIAPEIYRDRMVYSGQGYSYRTSDHSNGYEGMSLHAARQLFDSLPGAELVSYSLQSQMFYTGSSANQGTRRLLSYADENMWKLYDIPFIAGRPINSEEYSAHRNVIVITEHVARKEFGSADEALGKNLFVNFLPQRVVGVTKNVSSLFTWAFSDMWVPYDSQSRGRSDQSEGLRGAYTAMVLRRPDVSAKEMKTQIAASVERLNERLCDFTFVLDDVTTVAERTFFRDFAIPPVAIFVLLGMIMLVVPAINISGLIASQMSRRLSEIGVRKVYGASNRQLIAQLLTENLLLAAVGAIVGFLLSCLLMYLTKDWLLGSARTVIESYEQFDVSIFLFLRPGVFLCVFGTCLLFNLMSVFIPAWNITRHDIITTLKGE